MRFGSTRGRSHFVEVCIGRTDAQVVEDRAIEQTWILEYDGDVPAQGIEPYVANVLSIDKDAAGSGIVSSVQQTQRRALKLMSRNAGNFSS